MVADLIILGHYFSGLWFRILLPLEMGFILGWLWHQKTHHNLPPKSSIERIYDRWD